jgi:beta-N-acetylhexosaminidase
VATLWLDHQRTAFAGLASVVLVLAACQGSTPARRPDAASSAGLPLAPAPSCSTAQQVAGWTLRRQAEQTIVVPVQEADVAQVSAEVALGAGGVILFGNRAPTDLRVQLKALTDQARGGIAPLVMTDEEGGAVQRMANLVGSIPSARTMAATLTRRQVRRLAHRAGTRMHDAGVSMDLAPVLDLDNGVGPNATNPDGTRSFSLRATTTTRYGLAFARGLRDAGVVPVVKHFPGLGQATANTDVAPATTRPWTVLQKHGLLPFTAAVAAGMPAVMTANASIPGLTSLPASLSRLATQQVLRRQLAFHGLVVTDSLSAGAVSAAGFHVPRASVRALTVGADMVLFGAAPDRLADLNHRVVRAIVNAVRSGALPRTRLRRAVVHVLRAKQVTLCPSR